MIAMIVAYDRRRCIGSGGGIPWAGHMPADMAHFRKLTVGSGGNTVLMGRKTWESLDERIRPLSGRFNIVLSRNRVQVVNKPGAPMTACNDLHNFLDASKTGGRVFVIGGGEVYAQSLRHAETVYATEIDAEFNGDTYFPTLNEAEWEEAERQDHSTDERNLYPYSFVTYTRRHA